MVYSPVFDIEKFQKDIGYSDDNNDILEINAELDSQNKITFESVLDIMDNSSNFLPL